jgi:hypothetical protein
VIDLRCLPPAHEMSADELGSAVDHDPAGDVAPLEHLTCDFAAVSPLIPRGFVHHHGVDVAVGGEVLRGELLEEFVVRDLVRSLVIDLVELRRPVLQLTFFRSVVVHEILVVREQLVDGDALDLGLVAFGKAFESNGLVLLGGDAANHKNGLVHGRLPLYSVDVRQGNVTLKHVYYIKLYSICQYGARGG